MKKEWGYSNRVTLPKNIFKPEGKMPVSSCLSGNIFMFSKSFWAFYCKLAKNI